MFDDIYKGKTVLVTGHTGFKGSWLSIWLTMLGARVVGYSLNPLTLRDNFCVSKLSKKLFHDERADIRDLERLNGVISQYRPEMIFHLAAQALVRSSYEYPRETYEVNLMGSLNVLECVRQSRDVKAVLMVTSDKCYENLEQSKAYKETDSMGGHDPYSSSKGCTELMISSYRNSYFPSEKYREHGKSLASARTGNLIGGGDWSPYRLVPDCIKAIEGGEAIRLRNPKSRRPWMHVLEGLAGYLRLGQKLIQDPQNYSTSFNFGPGREENKTVLELTKTLLAKFDRGNTVDVFGPNDFHESSFLNLDVTKAFKLLNWRAKWGLEVALEKTLLWYKEALESSDMYDFCIKQIVDYQESE